jgi:hypothetical protein
MSARKVIFISIKELWGRGGFGENQVWKQVTYGLWYPEDGRSRFFQNILY